MDPVAAEFMAEQEALAILERADLQTSPTLEVGGQRFSYEVIGGQRYVLGLSWRQLRSGQGKKKTDDTAERCA
jgi:hypothetical protein